MDNISKYLNTNVRKPDDVMSLAHYIKSRKVTQEISSYMNNFLETLLVSPSHMPGNFGPNTITLCKGSCFFLELAFINRLTTHIMTQPFYGLLFVLGSDPLKFCMHSPPENWDPEVFDPFCRIQMNSENVLPVGDVLKIDGTKHVYDVLSTGSVVLKLISSSVYTKTWAFSRVTGEASHYHEANSRDSHLALTLSALSRIGDDESVQLLAQIAERHDNPTLRWEAIKSVASLSPIKAKELVLGAVKDSNPQVAKAALATAAANFF